MKTKMNLFQRIHAFANGRKLYWVASLGKLTFASSKEQCQSKFKGHEGYVFQYRGFLNNLKFALTGIYPEEYHTPKYLMLEEKITEIKQGDKRNNYRKGQILFNAVWNVDPKIANKIRGTDLDPFHNDSKIDACLKHILEVWSKE